MFNAVTQAMRQREEAAGATERITVTRAEFIRLMIAAGKTQKEAEFQAKVSVALGSEVLIGGRLVTIEQFPA